MRDGTKYKPHTVSKTWGQKKLMKSNICSPLMVSSAESADPGSVFGEGGNQEQFQFSVSDESEASASRACLFRTFQCKHSARLSNQSYTRSWQQMEGTG